MKSLLESFWQRRWCRALLWAAMVFGLACLHPFVRQTIFGPKIDGIPWCVWENRVRRDANVGQPRSLLTRILDAVGLEQSGGGEPDLLAPAALPVFLQLADDDDPRVRELSLQMLNHRLQNDHAAIVPVLRGHVDDADARCRLYAVRGIWRATKVVELWQPALTLLGNADPEVHSGAAQVLNEIAHVKPGPFESVEPLTEDANPEIRRTAIELLGYYGKQGVPVLRCGLRDKAMMGSALRAIAELKGDAADLIPDLLALQKNRSPYARNQVDFALWRVDPRRFPEVRDPAIPVGGGPVPGSRPVPAGKAAMKGPPP